MKIVNSSGFSIVCVLLTPIGIFSFLSFHLDFGEMIILGLSLSPSSSRSPSIPRALSLSLAQFPSFLPILDLRFQSVFFDRPSRKYSLRLYVSPLVKLTANSDLSSLHGSCCCPCNSQMEVMFTSFLSSHNEPSRGGERE